MIERLSRVFKIRVPSEMRIWLTIGHGWPCFYFHGRLGLITWRLRPVVLFLERGFDFCCFTSSHLNATKKNNKFKPRNLKIQLLAVAADIDQVTTDLARWIWQTNFRLNRTFGWTILCFLVPSGINWVRISTWGMWGCPFDIVLFTNASITLLVPVFKREWRVALLNSFSLSVRVYRRQPHTGIINNLLEEKIHGSRRWLTL